MGIWRDRLRVRVTQPLDNRLWRFWEGDTERYRIHHRIHLEAIPIYAPEVDLDNLRQRNRKIYEHVIHRYTEYAYHFRLPLTIEPRRGWLIPQPFRVLEESFPMVNDPWDGMKPRPSTLSYAAHRRSITLERAVVVTYAWHNYYHFFIDTLPQLALLDALSIDRDIPVVVPPQFATTRYVQDFRRLSTFLQGRTFMVLRPDEYVHVTGATYVAKDVFFTPATTRILDTLRSFPRGSSTERIFLRRDPAGPRSLSNDAEITLIAEHHGYRVVDTAVLSLEEQIELFCSAGVVVGVHGAGLTNIIFRRSRPLKLLEIAPAHLGSTHYKSLCKQFGYEYACLSGTQLDADRRFVLNPATFRQALDELETTSSHTSASAFRA